MTHHPTDGSAAESSSMMSTCSRGVISGPPHDRGTGMRKTPARFKAVTRSAGSRRAASISALRSWISPSSPLTLARM